MLEDVREVFERAGEEADEEEDSELVIDDQDKSQE